jgi:hypothetical protein
MVGYEKPLFMIKLSLTDNVTLGKTTAEKMEKVQKVGVMLAKTIKKREELRDNQIADHTKELNTKASIDIQAATTEAMTQEEQMILSVFEDQLTALTQAESQIEQRMNNNNEGHRKAVCTIKTILDADKKIVDVVTKNSHSRCLAKRDEVRKRIMDLYDRFSETWEFLFEAGTVKRLIDMMTECYHSKPQRTEQVAY